MAKQKFNWRNLGLPVYIVLVLLVVFGALFLFELVSFNPAPAEETLTPDQYSEVVNGLLEGADPVNGNALLDTYGCAACHRIGAANGIAPAFEGIAQRAGEIRPPLTAAEYIYEAIVHPSAYIVEGYTNSMAQDYGTRIPADELGDIIAYLLTPDAR